MGLAGRGGTIFSNTEGIPIVSRFYSINVRPRPWCNS